LKPISKRPHLTDLNFAINYNEIYDLLLQLTLNVYNPTAFIFDSKLAKYVDSSTDLNQAGREQGIRRLMSINLLKRLESSVYSFGLTVQRISNYISHTIGSIDNYHGGMTQLELVELGDPEEFDADDQNTDYFSVGKKVKIDLADMDYISWRKDLAADLENLELLCSMVAEITPQYDTKLQTLFAMVREKIDSPINPGNKKILIFTAF